MNSTFQPSRFRLRPAAALIALASIAALTVPDVRAGEPLPEGVLGWDYFDGLFNYHAYAPDPVTACQLTAKNHMGTPLLAMRKAAFNAVQYDCKYPHFMPVGAFWYGSTSLQCAPGYVSNWPGVCIKTRKVDPAPSSCQAGDPGVVRGNPVQLISGNKVQTEVDLQGKQNALLQISRTYRSSRMNGSAQSAGSAWSFSFDRELTMGTSAKLIQFSDANGSYFKFSRQPDGTYTSASDKRLRIQPDKSDFLLTNLKGDVERYALIGESYKMVSLHPASGGSAVYDYDGDGKLIKISDHRGRSVALSWADGTVSTIAGAGAIVSYEYEQATLASGIAIEGMARLIAVHYKDVSETLVGTRHYHYEDPRQRFLLTGISDESGKRFATYAYNEAAQAVLSEHAGGAQRYEFAYPSASMREVTDPLGTKRSYAIVAPGRIASESQPAGAGCSAGASASTYADNGDVTSSTDFNGQKTCFIRDGVRGLETTRFAGLGAAQSCPASAAALPAGARVTSTRWHPDWAIATGTAQPNRIETLVFNGQQSADGKVQHCAADAILPNGKPLAVLCSRTLQATTDSSGALGFAAVKTGAALTWTYTYNADGSLLSRTGPPGANGTIDRLTAHYYSDTSASHHPGDLESVSNGAGETTTVLAYTGDGEASVVKLHDVRTITLEYGPRRKLLASTVSAANGATETTRYQYDPAGQLTEVQTPDGARIDYAYDDAHRLTSVGDGAGNRVQFELDAMDNPVRQQIKGADGQLLAQALRTYDALNRLSREQSSESDPGSRFEYDKNGNLTGMTDPLGRATAYAYDRFDRLVQAKLPAPAPGTASGTIALAYSGLDQLLSVTDPRKLETRYQVDGLDRLNAVISRDTGTTSNTYDDAGQPLSTLDANGRKTSYQFDAAGHVTRIGTASFSYGAPGGSSAGKLTSMTDSAGQSSFTYDGFGRMASSTQLLGSGTGAKRFSVTRAYGTQGSASGHLSSLTYPSGNRVEMHYGSDGRVASITLAPAGGAAVTILSAVQYQPFGPARSWQWGSGNQLYQRRFDAENRLVTYPLGDPAKGGAVRTLTYDAAGRITQTRHAGGLGSKLDQRFTYDGLDRLTGFDGVGASQRFQYDANGNRTQLMLGNAVYNNLIDPASNRLASTTGPGPARRNSYDTSGALTSDGTLRYGYDAAGRLASAATAVGMVSYRYNGLGQRVAKTVANVTTYYVYDEAGRLLGEYDNAGVPLQETVYFEGHPVAVIKPSPRPALYYVYPDHLGTPRVITRAADQAMVWRWDNAAPFGEDQPDESPAKLEKFSYNLRFPGQLYDRETNTHYNYFRDYDPQLGRYVQSDPIGLDGGTNLYAYVGNHPTNSVDPTGQVIKIIGDRNGDYKKAIDYLKQDRGMKSIIDRLNNSPIPYTVNLNDEDDDGYDEDSLRLDWDPHSALCIKDDDLVLTGESQSPALGLGHELDHMANMIHGVHYTKHTKPYGTPEERRVIEGTEGAAAKTLGEGIRHNHFGKTVKVSAPTHRPMNCACRK